MYEKVTSDPTAEFECQLIDMLNRFTTELYIDEKLFDFLLVSDPVVPVLHTLPKIHKSLDDLLADLLCLSSLMWRFSWKILRGYTTSAKSYIKDTTNFFNKLGMVDLLEGVVLTSFDVVSLYTSISHKRGLRVVECSLPAMDEPPGVCTAILALL